MLISISVRKYFTNANTKKFFMPFIAFKLVSAILFVLIHVYIYKGGDTFLYFAGGKFISEQIFHSPYKFFNYIFGGHEAFSNFTYLGNYVIVKAFSDPSTLVMSQITALFGILGFQQFLATTILMSFFSAFGLWALYNTFCKLYPNGNKIFALCVLFFPSVGIWGSGILKDTITIAALGWMLQSVYYLVNRRKFIVSISLLALSVFLCLKLKPYILYTFLPAMLLWVQASITKQINNNFLRLAYTPILLTTFVIGGYFFFQTISENAGKYSIENVQSIAEGFNNWHTYLAENRNQSGYTLGDIEYTPLGILSKTPEALFVTFYRPRPDEIRNFATAFESLQSTALLIISIVVLFKVGFIKFFKITFRNSDVRAFLVFAILLGIAIGLTSYNFGALSRYKIPCLPFYSSALAIIFLQGKRKLN